MNINDLPSPNSSIEEKNTSPAHSKELIELLIFLNKNKGKKTPEATEFMNKHHFLHHDTSGKTMRGSWTSASDIISRNLPFFIYNEPQNILHMPTTSSTPTHQHQAAVHAHFKAQGKPQPTINLVNAAQWSQITTQLAAILLAFEREETQQKTSSLAKILTKPASTLKTGLPVGAKKNEEAITEAKIKNADLPTLKKFAATFAAKINMLEAEHFKADRTRIKESSERKKAIDIETKENLKEELNEAQRLQALIRVEMKKRT
ncbi:MAG: hypothetical protein JWO53_931 [Chlamydiia bacterium]|nr:hypothetical protein [Chlamydiia bacterium]